MDYKQRIVKWMNAGLTKPGKTPLGLARALGVDRSAIYKIRSSKGEGRGIKAHELEIMRIYFEEDSIPQEIKNPLESTLQPTVIYDSGNFYSNRRIPILEYTQNSNGSIRLGKKMGTTPALMEQENDEDCFVIEAKGNMRPRYRDMEKIHVSRNRRPKIGGDCYIEIKTGDWFIREFVELTDKEIIARDINTGKQHIYKMTDVTALHKVAGRD